MVADELVAAQAGEPREQGGVRYRHEEQHQVGRQQLAKAQARPAPRRT